MKELDQVSGKKADVNKEVQKFVEKKEQSKGSHKLPTVDDKYQELANLRYVSDGKTRKELVEIIDELMKIEGLSLKKTGGHDLSVKYKGKQIVKICPLKKGWSASLNGGKIQSYSKDQIIDAVMNGITTGVDEDSKPSPKQDDKEVIKKLEERIAKMGKGSKGISTKGIKVTSEIKNWAKTKGYTLTGDTLLVNRAVN